MIYWIGKGIIRNKINAAVTTIKSTVEDKINQFITSEYLINVGHGSGLGLNVTNIDRPQLVSYNSTTIQRPHLGFMMENSFLATTTAPKSSPQKTLLTFGVHGSIYAVGDPSLLPKVPDAVNMQFPVNSFNNKFTMLLSDYTLNTLFFMVQGSGMIHTTFDNDTSTLPFSIDTDGLSVLVPELQTKFPNNTKMNLKLFVSAIDHDQPTLNTDSSSNTLTLNFGADFLVFNSTDPFDDPGRVLQLNIRTHLSIQTFVSSNKLNIIIFKTVVDSAKPTIDDLDVDQTKIAKSMSTFINQLLDMEKSSLTNIDILGLLKSKLGVNATNMIIRSDLGYTSFSFDISDL